MGTGGDWAEGAPLSDPHPGAPGAQSAPPTSGLLPGGTEGLPSPTPPPACGTPPHQPQPHTPMDRQPGWLPPVPWASLKVRSSCPRGQPSFQHPGHPPEGVPLEGGTRVLVVGE